MTCADFIVAGSHKWMGAYLPTGIGLYGQRWSQEMIGRRLRSLESTKQIDDPLLQITEQLDGGNLYGRSETINLNSLFACSGAAFDRTTGPQGFMNRTVPGVDVARKLIPQTFDDWQPIVPCGTMQSHIVLIEAQNTATRGEPADSIRSRWLEAGRVVSAYPGGRVRMSIGPVIDSPG